MKWGHHYEKPANMQLLFWVLQCVLRPHLTPLDRWLKHALTKPGGIGGDPGWSMERLPAENGGDSFLVWGEPEMSGIEPAERIYTSDLIYKALRESLLAFAEAYPDREEEVRKVLHRYGL